ncbi:MAG: PASTA domain-containing protein [Anaerolineae bacterium]|nr:PASTA domain-containing protein [Anaerolineae bacterium]
MRAYRFTLYTLVGLALAVSSAAAQTPAVAVPDVTGLSVPAAATRLHEAGLRLGAIESVRWEEASGLPVNTVSQQAPTAGESVDAGAAIGLTVLRTPNVALVYDDNDLTLINQTGGNLPLAGISLSSSDGAALFRADRWPVAGLGPGDCGQVWSVPRGDAKDVEGCGSIFWLTTSNNAEHAWTALNNVTAFNLAQNGVVRTTCPAAPANSEPIRCEAYVPAPDQAEETAFVYFAYTDDRFVVANPSADQWMPLNAATVYNFNPNMSVPGAGVPLGDPSLYGAADRVEEVSRLAPGECLLLTRGQLDAATPPIPCRVIAQLSIDPTVIFWAAPFEMESVSDGVRRACPASTPGKPTLCILPR